MPSACPSSSMRWSPTGSYTGSTGQAEAESETWWVRWRKRGLIIRLATVVAAAAAVLQLYGWVPWK